MNLLKRRSTLSILGLLSCLSLVGQLSTLRGADTPGALLEIWTGIPGVTVGDLTNHVRFPSQPDVESILSQFETPTDVMENYGQRVQAYLSPPATGDYIFWIASDDNSTLYLSTDENPANKSAVAYVPVGPTPGNGSGMPNNSPIPSGSRPARGTTSKPS